MTSPVEDAPRPLWKLITAADLRDHPIQVASIVLVLLAALVAPPAAVVVSTVRRLSATEEVTGTVVHVALFHGKRPSRQHTFTYRFGGVAYRDTLTTRQGGPQLDVGEPIRLFLDPAAPHRPYPSRRLQPQWLVLTFFFWGVAALLLCLRHVPSGRALLVPRFAWAFALVFTAASFFALPPSHPFERWWLIPVQYLGVLAVTAVWLLVRRRSRADASPGAVRRWRGRERRG